MSLKNISRVLGALLVASGSAALAAEYRPDDFLTLDLSKAVLSPTPLGPTEHFVPGPVKARGDTGDVKSDGKTVGESRASQARPAAERGAARQLRRPRVLAEGPRGSARVRLAHRHGNPLDAQAMDRRIQVWPCRSGGICNWKPLPAAAE
jgi:hypothetical protein